MGRGDTPLFSLGTHISPHTFAACLAWRGILLACTQFSEHKGLHRTRCTHMYIIEARKDCMINGCRKNGTIVRVIQINAFINLAKKCPNPLVYMGLGIFLLSHI